MGISDNGLKGAQFEREVSVLEGAIFDSQTGKPLPMVYIYLHHYDTMDGESIEFKGSTDEAGRYAVALGWGMPIVPLYYSFEKNGYSSENFEIPKDATQISKFDFNLDVPLVSLR